ncbi:dynein heavy chain 11, axonemal [Chanos chanos]|uniref:Dynein heavy chain 11, axonemal n=1 Tax=Chanos chanos TaxID=29144 RepID=A0A6J2VVD4_CHACN|nr:dynein heavy chain 11, axonemal-like [Chanos chanos]
MSDEDEVARVFSEDAWVQFIGDKLCQMMKIKSETWDKFVALEENQRLLSRFFEQSVKLLIFSLTSASTMTVSTEVSHLLKQRGYYILKKDNVTVLSESCRQNLLFGVLSPSPLPQLSNSLEKVCVPLLSNRGNHQTWPNTISEDIVRHVQSLQNKVSAVRGQIRGKTVLPVPAVSERRRNCPEVSGKLHDGPDRTVVHAIESMVISWTHLIQKVLKEDSAEILLQGLMPGPSSELEFWRARRENIQNIYEQLHSPAVQKMRNILEVTENSYYPSFKALTEDVSEALQEAKDVDLHLRPLQPLLSHLEEEDFPSIHPLIRQLFHLIYLVWRHCESYRSPARMIVLLQELCNLLIQQAQSYLSLRDLLREEAEDSLEKLQKVESIFRCFRDTFQMYREKVSGLVNSGESKHCWDFPTVLVFSRFDSVFARVLKLEEIFSITLEFQKLEKVIFGGQRGKLYSEQVSLLLAEFLELLKAFREGEYNPLDLTCQQFVRYYEDFKDKVQDLDRQLATVLGLTLKDCSGLESVFKLLALFRPFLDREIIKQTFTHSFPMVLELFSVEMDQCKQLYSCQLQQLRTGKPVLSKNMPATSGALKWARMLRNRIQIPWESFQFVLDRKMDGEGMQQVHLKYMEMSTLLDHFEEEVYSAWGRDINQVCQLNLDQPLIKREPHSALLHVNFNPELLAVLKDVKHLHMLDQKNIPSVAMAVYDRRDTYLMYIGSLQLLVQMYNKVRQTMLEVEAPLISAELETIDQQLQLTETELTWQHQSCLDYICAVRGMVHSLERRLQKSKDNLEKIQNLMEGWKQQPMFCRKDNKKDTLLLLEDRDGQVLKRYRTIQRDGETIHNLVKENHSLLVADRAYGAWQVYVEHVDDMLVEGFFCAISHSLEFFLENMENSVCQAPLFEAQMVLSGSEITFRPSLDRDAGESLYELLEGLLGDIFKMSAQVKRVAPHVNMEDYQGDMEEMLDLSDLRQEVMERVDDVIRKAVQYQCVFDRYSHLWLDDRAEFLRQFLLYGQALTAEEVEAFGEGAFSENPPTTEKFKEQIDLYEELYIQVGNIEDFRVFEGWFRVDIRPFKTSLLNSIKKWSWMFKEHLISYVIDSVVEWGGFIEEADTGLRQTVQRGDRHALVQVMGHLLSVRDRQTPTDLLFEPLRAVLSLLEQYNEKLPEHIYAQLEELPEKWNSVRKLALSVKHEVAPLQNAEVSVIRRKCAAFEMKLSQFTETFKTDAPFTYNSVNPYVCLDKCHREISSLEEEMAELQDSCRLFEVSSPEYRQLRHCRKEIIILKQVWDQLMCTQWCVRDWTRMHWRDVHLDQMDYELRRFLKELHTLDKEARGWDVYVELDNTLKNHLTFLRTITELQNPAVRNRHWAQLFRITKADLTLTDRTTLAELLALHLHIVEEEVRAIMTKAVKEMAIEKVLTEISQTWASTEFVYEKHCRTSTPMLRCDDAVIERLEENQVQLQLISQSKHVEFFQQEVSELQAQLGVVDSVLLLWLKVQRTWAHLESVFTTSDDIFRQLPDEAKRFLSIDTDFKDLMVKSAKTKNIIAATNKPYLLETLEDLQNRLALCEKALVKYLETKRLSFPRFYFISSADLLDILSKGSRPKQITHHLAKLFDSVVDLEFSCEGSNRCAVGMYSKEGEYMPFHTPCDCTGLVELWLTRLEDSMRLAVRQHISDAVVVYEDRPREQWILEHPAQVALTGSQIWWTADVGLAFERLNEGFETAMRDYNKKQVAQLHTLISLLTGDMRPGDRQKIMTVCTIDVHARDVVSELLSQKVTSSQAFLWLSQLRYHWDEEQRQCFANICDAQFQYSYEYLGNTPRLVITPLTDRCYITLTQSLHLTMGGAPSGPAGTGKTETTKDLGRALGVMVYVFNCSEQMDYKSTGNMFKGLAQTGAWGCFDEFNRISVEVLSVVATQVKTIQDAIRNKISRFVLLEEEMNLRPSVGIFITMNPGYAGRTELPENLKALFRPCAMVVPDLELICEIMLMAEGFVSARVLGRKFITLYSLCRELLSNQDHYDWGLRAVKSVLVVAGALKRADETRPEDQVLMRALRDFNMPKIVTEDIPAFLGLIGDLFPGLEVPRRNDPEFEKVVRQSTLELSLQPEESFILKVVQLEELLTVRHSVFVVGNAGTGKSQILRTLHKTYSNMKRKPVWASLNPKALSTDELFGFIHPSTREWKDGLLSQFLREQAANPHLGPKWVVLDGDIDPVWIESLNTVMDDNKILTLVSNERIALTPSMRLVFEVSHLSSATPATVSRAGVLYINPQDLGWSPFVTSWVDSRARQAEKAHLTILFDKYVPPCLEQMRTTFKTVTPIPENSMVQTLCTLLDCLLTPENVPGDSAREVYEMYFVFACIWAFGGASYQDQHHDHRAEFSQWWTKEMKTVKLPPHGTVFDFYLDTHTKRFLPWTDRVPAFEPQNDTGLQALFVPTAETVCVQFFMRLFLEKARPVMLVGCGGVGKTSLVTHLLQTLPDTFSSTRVPFNFYTTSSTLQRELERPLEKRAGRNYAPPRNKKLIYFIDDFNMAAVDSFGTVQPHALVRQHLDYAHWYDREKRCMKEIHNTQYIVCTNPTAGGFTINARLQRHFSVLAVSFPGAGALCSIFGSILNQHLQSQSFSGAVLRTGASVVQAAVSLHRRVTHSLRPSATRFHYLFSLWDLSRVFQGLCFSSPGCVRDICDLVHLWMHESNRVYSDRLIESSDSQLFHRLLQDTIHSSFEGLDETTLQQQPLMYWPCGQQSGAGPGRVFYEPVRDLQQLRSVLTEALESYNELHSAMNLVLFEEAMQHVCRIGRVLACPRGYALLVGVGGSGRRSLTRLAAYHSSMDVFQVTLRKGYSLQDLKADLAGLYIRTGVKNLPTVLLLTDTQIPDEQFLTLISDLLASGEIADLFNEEEEGGIVRSVRGEVRATGLLDSAENCWRFFMERVRRQLKVVLCMSPVGGALRTRAHRFPALFHCSTIDWFHDWSQQALQSVSLSFIQQIPGLPPSMRESISAFMAHVHVSSKRVSESYRLAERRHNYSTPRRFLELLDQYRVLLTQRQDRLQQNMGRLQCGLQKLQTTASQVEELKAKLNSQEADLSVKRQAADALVSRIALQTERVSQKRGAADMEEQKVKAVQYEVALRQKECENDLAKAEPALEAATAALDTLNKVNLTELKTFPSPPQAVTNVTAAVMVLLAPRGRVPKDRGWKAARAFMGKVDDFLQSLVSYNKENIPETSLAVVKKEYLRDPEFHPDLIRTKSYAAAGLCAWVINIVRYYEVYCEVAPKRQALCQANSELDTATAKLLTVRQKLEDLDANLRSLTAQFENAAADKVRCQEEVTHTSQTMALANRLVRGLQSEEVRWSQAQLQLEDQMKTVCGDVLLAAAFVSYAGYFTQSYRHLLLHGTWLPFLREQTTPVPLTDGLDPVRMLAEDATVAAWHNLGLPDDGMSAENAAILTHSQRWTLLVDPQQRAVKWIHKLYREELRVLQPSQAGYLDVMEQALACGETVLLENVEEKLDSALESLLARNTTKRGRYIKMGDKECEFNSSFRLLLHTKLANPHFSPELQAQITLINFTVTPSGLEEQLLCQVVNHERPDLEKLKWELTTQQNQCKIELKRLEDELLGGLAAAEGNFLGDVVLVERLENTKSTASLIHCKVVEARENEAKINEARELYRPVAQRASLLYFIIKDLHHINPMYQYSLKAFNTVFLRAMERTPHSEEVTQRVASLTESVTYSIFLHISHGLFETDKLTFLSHTALQILLMRGSIDVQELDFLLRFPVEASRGSPVNFLSPQAWGAVKSISLLPEFRGLDRDIEGSAKRWRKLVESESPERETFPQDWKNKNTLQRLLILRALRPDRIAYALRGFVEETLGSGCVNLGRLEFEKVFEETSPSTPLFFILSPGLNPLGEVEKLGVKLGFSVARGNLQSVSLGQGQDGVAERALETAAREGHWVILENVHLMPRWLGHLERLLEKTAAQCHHDYRVFMSGEPPANPQDPVIPRSILENALKLTHEPPAGMNASLHATLSNFSQETLELCSHELEFKALFFSICYFHACVCERRRFGPQGWNCRYPFNRADLNISINILYNHLESSTKVPWEDLHYLFGEVVYGGHITDDWDRRLCRTYLHHFLNPKLFEGDLFLCPGFLAPPDLDYTGYHRYVDENLPPETPSLYGMHPNAEIDHMTATSDALFRTLLELQPKDFVLREGASHSIEEKVRSTVDELLEKLPEDYSMVELTSKTAGRGPYTLVCLQECERMNALLSAMRSSLRELDQGLRGELTLSSDMESLQTALFYENVPESWSRLACPTTKTLALWFSDLISQCQQLDTWTQDFVQPAVVWLSGLFNPQAFLTVIMQTTARKNAWALDTLSLSVDVTRKTKEEFGHPAREGAYIHGLHMEGARWDGGSGLICEAVLRELSCAMPVVYVRAVPGQQQDLRHTYRCPLYRTRLRGSTYVCSFHLRTQHSPARWTLAGVALLLSV